MQYESVEMHIYGNGPPPDDLFSDGSSMSTTRLPGGLGHSGDGFALL